MIHVIECQDSPRRGANEWGHPTNEKIHAMVGVGVGQEHVDHQDVVEMEALKERIQINLETLDSPALQ